MRKPAELINYRDYIKSEYWTERKRLYFSTHPHVCAVCAHTDVELHHLKYGDYGREQDKNHAALCRVHHQELHDAIVLRKNTFYQSNSMIEDMRAKWNEAITKPIQSAQKPSASKNPLADFIEQLAQPIWHLLGKK